jgi:acyl-CoA reductase-like NAD-dependent aldehyde dehydrogenase
MGERKAKMLRNMALKEQARMPELIQRQRMLREEISQSRSLIERMSDLRAETTRSGVSSAQRLQSDRWYELRLIDESEILQNKLDFLETEMRDLTTIVTQIGHKQQIVSNKADEVARLARQEKETRIEAAEVALRPRSRISNY